MSDEPRKPATVDDEVVRVADLRPLLRALLEAAVPIPEVEEVRAELNSLQERAQDLADRLENLSDDLDTLPKRDDRRRGALQIAERIGPLAEALHEEACRLHPATNQAAERAFGRRTA